MKRWLLIGIPLAIFGALLFVKPPTFTTYKSTIPNSSTLQPSSPNSANSPNSNSGVKPNIGGGGYGNEPDENGLVNGEKPVYGGHEADKY